MVEGDNDANDGTSDNEGKKHKKKQKFKITYKPGTGLTMQADKTKLTVFLGIETVMLEGHCIGSSCAASDGLTLHVRRARFSVEAKLPNHLRIDFGLQIKNEILVLKNANLAWKSGDLTVKAGFLKPPGGLERDSSTWLKPFPERSVVANFKQDRIIGLMATRWFADRSFRVQGAAGHPPTGNFDAFEPEDVVKPPKGVEAEDLTKDPGNWDLFLTGTYEPSENFEISLNATAHTSPDAGRGPNFAEPYETKIVTARFIKGTFLGGGSDVSWHGDHVRASAEIVGFRSGETIPHTDDLGNPLEPTKAERGVAGYFVFGATPNGHYGRALDNSPLRGGWQWLLRGEFLRVTPGEHSGDALFMSGTTGVEWQVNEQLRLQADVAVQKYNGAVIDTNRDVWRIYSEVWAQVLM